MVKGKNKKRKNSSKIAFTEDLEMTNQDMNYVPGAVFSGIGALGGKAVGPRE